MNDKPHSKFLHVYAVIRFDSPVDPASPENSMAIVKVFSSKSVAEKEASRLNKLNAAKGGRYIVQVTRFVR